MGNIFETYLTGATVLSGAIFLLMSFLFALSFKWNLRTAALFFLTVAGMTAAIVSANLTIIAAGLFMATAGLTLLNALSDEDNGGSKNIWFFLLGTDALFIFGAIFFFGATGSFNISKGGDLLNTINNYHTGNYFRVALAGITTALVAKCALVPLGWWIFDAAKTPNIQLTNLNSVLYRLGVLAIALKIFSATSALWGGALSMPLAILGVVTLAWANLRMLGAKGSKEFIIHSANGYIGYIFVAISLLPAAEEIAGMTAMTLLATFALAHAGLFTALQVISEGTSNASFDSISRRYRFVAAGSAVLFASLAGLPALSGFWGRFEMTQLLTGGGHYILLAVVGVNMIFGCYLYLLRIVKIYSGQSRETEEHDLLDVGYPVIFSFVITVVLSIYLGLLPNALTIFLRSIFKT